MNYFNIIVPQISLYLYYVYILLHKKLGLMKLVVTSVYTFGIFKLFLDFTDLLGRMLPMLMVSPPLLASKSFGNGKEFVSSHLSFF
jgi:hypothetical protein